jgi:hypothetical protein
MYPTTRTALLVIRDRMNDEYRRADNDRRWRKDAGETEADEEPTTVRFGTLRRLVRRGRPVQAWG